MSSGPLLRRTGRFCLCRKLLSLQQRFFLIRTEVKQVQVVLSSSCHLLLLRPCRVGSSVSRGPVGHHGGNTGAAAPVDVSPCCTDVSHVGNRGNQVWLCRRANFHRVHLSNTRFHLRHKTFRVRTNKIQQTPNCPTCPTSFTCPTCLSFRGGPCFSREDAEPISLGLGCRWRQVGLWGRFCCLRRFWMEEKDSETT